MLSLFLIVPLMGEEECNSDTDDLDGDGWSEAAGDCDDSDALIAPDALERCNDAIDQNCDGSDLVPSLLVSMREDAPESAYLSIQSAIDDATAGQCIWVEAETYHERLNFLGKDIIVAGENSETTILLPFEGGSVVTFASGETSVATLEHFRITEGTGTAAYNNYATGGGVLIVDSSPTLRENVITNNNAYYGGGVGIIRGAPVLIGNTISENVAQHNGGGVFMHDAMPLLQACDISDNQAGSLGGGVYGLEANVHIDCSTLTANTATTGAGLYVLFSAGTINNTVFSSNSADYGGGIYLNDSVLLLENLIVDHNWANVAGGGMYLRSEEEISILNSTVAYNATDGGGDGIYVRSDLLLNSSIFAFNEEDHTNVYNPSSYTVNAQYNLFYDASEESSGVYGFELDETNIVADPLLTSADNFHLLPESPAVNTGTPDNESTDPDGSRNDMGAYGGPASDSW